MSTITLEGIYDDGIIKSLQKVKTKPNKIYILLEYGDDSTKQISNLNSFIGIGKKKTISDFIGIGADIPKNINYKDIASNYLYNKYLKND